jgi:hypothetical protein
MIRTRQVLAILFGLSETGGIVLFLLSLIVSSSLPAADTGPIPGRFVVKLSGRANIAVISQRLDSDVRMVPLAVGTPDLDLANGGMIRSLYIVETADRNTTADQVRQLVGIDNVEYIEPDYFLELFAYPTDSLFGAQWGLRNTGQVYRGVERRAGPNNDTLVLKSGVAGSDINLDPLYQQPGDHTATVVVAIIDSGTDLKHPELQGRFWRNFDEVPDNRRDDDHNGFVDDTLGYDLSGDNPDFFNLEPDNNPTDSIGHGTHVAGIVAADQNGTGVVGVAPSSLIMPIKIYPNASSSIGAAAIVYAVTNGARVINISWGSPYESFVLEEALQFARDNGVFVAIASGNSGSSEPSYPGASPGAFTVGAGNSVGDVTYFSSYGEHLDIVAPGEDILSLRAAGTDMYTDADEPDVHIIDSLYYLSDGTSMATPMVAGAAALVWTMRPDVSLDELESAFRQGATDLLDPLARGDTLPGFDSLSGHGYLDVGSAMQLLPAGGLHFVTPEPRGRFVDSVTIRIAPVGIYFGGYSLSYSLGPGSTNWTPLATAPSLPGDSIAYVFTSADGSGYVNLRLIDDNGRESFTTFALSPENRLDLTGPSTGEELAFAISIHGSANGPDYDSLTISYRGITSPLEQIFAGTSEYFDSLIFVWSLSDIPTGNYEIILSGFFGETILSDSVGIVILNSFAAGWPQTLPARPGISPMAADLDNDGFKEIVCGTQSGLYVYGYDGIAANGFPVQQGIDMRCIPAAYDIDKDGFDEIIAIGEDGLHAYNGDGTIVPGFPRLFPATLSQAFGYPTPGIAELGGAAPDSAIVLVSNIGEIRAYRFDGTPYFYSLDGWFADFTSQLIGTGYYANDLVTSADLDGDGVEELVATYAANAPYAGSALFDNRNGRPAWNRASPNIFKAASLHGSLLVDLTGDGRPEIVTSGYDSTGRETIWATTQGTEPLPGWPVTLPEVTDWISSQPTAADLDNDGIPEIIATYFEFDIAGLYIFRADGTPYLSVDGRPAGEVFSYPATFGTPMAADLVGDSSPEIVFRSGYILPTTGTEKLFVLDNRGNLLPGWPVSTPNRPSSVFSSPFAPLIDDIDNDGLVELLLYSDDNSILVWNFPASFAGGSNYARINGDNRNSGRVVTPTGMTRIGEAHDHTLSRQPVLSK